MKKENTDDIRYPECNTCLYDGYELIGCQSCKLHLAWQRLLNEIPIVKLFVAPAKKLKCNWYEPREDDPLK